MTDVAKFGIMREDKKGTWHREGAKWHNVWTKKSPRPRGYGEKEMNKKILLSVSMAHAIQRKETKNPRTFTSTRIKRI